MKEIMSHGGGTQSAAMTALVVLGKLPRPDYVVIADTELERQTTWQYLDAVIRPALAKIGIEVHRVRGTEWFSQPPHKKAWLSHNGEHVLLPAFTSHGNTGSTGKMSGFCSARWKTEVMNRYVREHLGIPTRDQRNWIGYSLDESKRATRMMLTDDYKDGRIRLPLIHDVPMLRRQAIQLVESMGWPTPPRSACWMCPNQGDNEWRDLKLNHPEEFRKACELEKEIQAVDPHVWMHKLGIPLGDVDFTSQATFFDSFGDKACESGTCFL